MLFVNILTPLITIIKRLFNKGIPHGTKLQRITK